MMKDMSFETQMFVAAALTLLSVIKLRFNRDKHSHDYIIDIHIHIAFRFTTFFINNKFILQIKEKTTVTTPTGPAHIRKFILASDQRKEICVTQWRNLSFVPIVGQLVELDTVTVGRYSGVNGLSINNATDISVSKNDHYKPCEYIFSPLTSKMSITRFIQVQLMITRFIPSLKFYTFSLPQILSFV